MSNERNSFQTGSEESRKKDHIQLAFKSQTKAQQLDQRFDYEPLLGGNLGDDLKEKSFFGKIIKIPIWASSMTGGTAYAATINKNIASVCGQFGMGMGLGSCRQLLNSDEFITDFQVRRHIGDSAPLFANFGIAQVEELVEHKKESLILELCKKLEVDGFFVHINPLQEYLQPEGDRYKNPPIETMSRLLEKFQNSSLSVAVKEVGQGMGPKSINELLQLPIIGIEFGAFGGTNFSKIESLRNNDPIDFEVKSPFINLGHTAEEMINFVNESAANTADKHIIISGGVKNSLDGFSLMEKCKLNSVYGMASQILKYAINSREELERYISKEIEALKLAKMILKQRHQ